jgi:hypothetical protein
MARKLNVTKLPRQDRPDAEVLNRRPQTPTSTLYLMQLRAQSLKIPSHSSPVRLEIDAEPTPESPESIKIKCLD